ncbi:hypothetical protein KKG22_02765 [Patescibacteria group bacterium]|nr:hypothetical protein [Patescibacteria group bacterium]MBU1721714.1 hypothetical protein [Patescibacteria group bacterium]MBU1901869.1 hypothetical protein [Patescibacteria group bacterium]
MRRNRQSVTIQAPPIQELSKQRSCIKRSCTTGCGCLVFVFIGLFIFLQLLSRPNIKNLKELPEPIEKILPLYDKSNIDRIEYIQGGKKHQTIERLAVIPKFILSPIVLLLEKNIIDNDNPPSAWKRFTTFMDEPVTDQRDTYTIEWSRLPAEPSFILQFYIDALEKQSFVLQQPITSQQQYIFIKDNMQSIIYIRDNAKEQGTDYFSIIFYSPSNF